MIATVAYEQLAWKIVQNKIIAIDDLINKILYLSIYFEQEILFFDGEISFFNIF
jgi:hypothetical protein